MDRICGKCGACKPDASWSASEGCPKCGAVYAKVEQHQQATADKARVEAEQRQAPPARYTTPMQLSPLQLALKRPTHTEANAITTNPANRYTFGAAWYRSR